MAEESVLVTGGAGFIGSHLVRGLLRQGHAVRVIDDYATGRIENLEDVRGDIDLVESSLLDSAALARAVRGVTVVFHEAAIPSVARSARDPMRSHEANVTSTVALLNAAREADVERLIYASSSSVYGGIDALPVHEELPTVPVSPYGASKLAGEQYCRAFTRTFGFPTISLRYFNVFGPRQDPTSEYAAVIPRFALALIREQPPVIFGDGRQSRDFTYVDNVIEGNLLAARASEEAFGGVFNVAQGGRHTLLELLVMLESMLDVGSAPPQWEAPRAGDVRHSQADVSAAGRLLGYRPLVTFEEGLRRTVDWLRSVAPAAVGL